MKWSRSLTLGELEAFASTGLTGLLTLLHPRIATKKTFGFQRCPEFWVRINQCARNREPQSTSLAVDSTAVGVHPHIKLIELLCDFKRTKNRVLESLRFEVIFKRPTVGEPSPSLRLRSKVLGAEPGVDGRTRSCARRRNQRTTCSFWPSPSSL